MVSPLSPPAAARPLASPNAPPPAPDRRLGRRAGPPNGRAVVGGLLVMVAVVATFAAITSARSGPTQTFVVARTSIDVGHRIEVEDLRTITGDLPGEVAETSFGTVDELVGAVALAPLTPDDLITRSEVQLAADPGNAFTRSHELSFALDRAHALDGKVQRGEELDIVAVFGSGEDSYTKVVARRVRVLAVGDRSEGSVGIEDTVTITVALDQETEVLATTHALATAKVTLVRATRADPGEPQVDTYRPPAADRTDAGGSGSRESPSTAAGSSTTTTTTTTTSSRTDQSESGR
jgi:Flp pilus assembly protein CpaB